MSQFWKVDDSVRVGEKKISVPSENGLSYSPGQKVQLFVDPSTKFMDGRETYLQFNVLLSLPSGGTPTRLQLDKCSSTLIKNLRIYDGSRGQLLEEIADYSTYVSVKYDYDKDKNLENLRALREACHVHQPDNRGTLGTTKTAMANTITNPYFKKTSGDQTTAFSNTDFLKAKVSIPLHTGIFADSSTVFPVMMTNGLYIEIDLSEAADVIKQLDSVLRDVRTGLNPLFHSINGSSSPDNWINGSGQTTFYVTDDNNIGGSDAVSKFPFVVGETIGFCRLDNNGSGGTLSAAGTISEINLSSDANGGAGLVEVVLGSSITNNLGVDIVSEEWVIYSTAVADAATYDASYTVSDVNLIVSQVILDPAYERGMIQKVREGKAIEFDIMSATNYKNSILASERQTTFQIYAQNSRAKSLLVVPQDSTVYTTAERISGSGTYVIKGTNHAEGVIGTKDVDDVCLASTRSAYTGICDFLSTIQYTMNGKRVPSREISVKKCATKNSIDAFHIYELEKTLDNAGIPPRSFVHYLDNFCFGRGFSAGGQNGVLDLRGKDLAVILKYQETTQPSKPKLFNSFVFHIRRLTIRDGAVDVTI
jgi:hypothetical protein